MRNILLLLTTLLFSTTLFSQIFEPIKWESSVKEESENVYILSFAATLEKGWHIYSQKEVDTDDIAPTATEFTFYNEEKAYELVGETIEPEGIQKFDKVFEMDIKYFEDSVVFTQKIKRLDPSLKTVKVEVFFGVCDDEKCLAPDIVEFNLNLSGKNIDETENPDVSKSSSEDTDRESTSSSKDSNNDEKGSQKGLWSTFILAFLSGFAALLTPCVFPMIPMTVSFFTKQSKNRATGIKNAIFYGIFIIVIYVGLGSVVTAIFGADALNALSTNVWFNLLFFALLIVFGLSFLGAFEIMLPNSWANKVDRQADKGGMIGIFFMALALAIVSFSCTGPIVGTILVEAASKGGIAPIIGMLGFSLAIALPFALFAMFPGWLNSLPKSGGWLNTVKVFLGFLELAFAFKFLSNADLVLQLGLLQREIFLSIWIAIFGTLALYLLGKVKLPHDSPIENISVGRLSIALLTLAFTIYLIPGLWGAPLKLISGFPPPQTYSESPRGFGGSSSNSLPGSELPEGAKYGEHDIISFTDYQTGLDYAKKVNKPVLIDFTGYACVNCRKMEEYVWSEPAVLKTLKNDVVLISLYVDYKKELPESEQYVSKTTGKKIKTIGNKWSDFQITRYKANAQPYYVLVDHNEENLSKPVGYTPNENEYLGWLKKGIDNFSVK
ncbi:thiol:disulfide interchange protein [Aquimarina sp. AD1]|uniref:protein-disulfide reductase DsbD family protein n=1 Tax=Aquimarina sp. (strain AD1) TaxID=1714848 RepID=UPI000E5446D5|nr:thioredoxin family protein [Aquimarina sp. AD1]AXT55948.1 thiol:disulfide interchange protein [Aquimarina sp. AD1]RKN37703.1 thiol:disulfide interchange protein [Aquimarina sp. AD1]